MNSENHVSASISSQSCQVNCSPLSKTVLGTYRITCSLQILKALIDCAGICVQACQRFPPYINVLKISTLYKNNLELGTHEAR